VIEKLLRDIDDRIMGLRADEHAAVLGGQAIQARASAERAEELELTRARIHQLIQQEKEQ
jgi:hypothetical protein